MISEGTTKLRHALRGLLCTPTFLVLTVGTLGPGDRRQRRDLLGGRRRYSRAPDHDSPEWPAGYWPATTAPPDDAAWETSRAGFLADLEAMQGLVVERAEHLLEPLPHAEVPHTLLREALLLADHNAYHLGQMVSLRRRLGAWPGGEGAGG